MLSLSLDRLSVCLTVLMVISESESCCVGHACERDVMLSLSLDRVSVCLTSPRVICQWSCVGHACEREAILCGLGCVCWLRPWYVCW
jgi:hypothetical protein